MRPPRLLTLCFPTYGKANELHLNSRGDAVVLAPDEFHRMLLAQGWEIDVVSFGPMTDKLLFCSKLPLRNLNDVKFDSYDVYWHMFRDPTQPEVLRLLEGLRLDYAGKPVINPVEHLQHHNKHRYSRKLFAAGIGPEIVPTPSDRLGWLAEESCWISPDQSMIQSYAYNNNRGDYLSERTEPIVTRYVNNAVDGIHSTVRFGFAYGGGFVGFQYFSPRLAFKSGGADRREPYTVDPRLHSRIQTVIDNLGINVCHIDAVPTGDDLLIIDINPYPTSNGSSLSPITQSLVEQIVKWFGLGRS